MSAYGLRILKCFSRHEILDKFSDDLQYLWYRFKNEFGFVFDIKLMISLNKTLRSGESYSKLIKDNDDLILLIYIDSMNHSLNYIKNVIVKELIILLARNGDNQLNTLNILNNLLVRLSRKFGVNNELKYTQRELDIANKIDYLGKFNFSVDWNEYNKRQQFIKNLSDLVSTVN